MISFWCYPADIFIRFYLVVTIKYFHNESKGKKITESLISLHRGNSLSPYGPVNGNGMFLIAAQRWLAGSDSLRALLATATELFRVRRRGIAADNER